MKGRVKQPKTAREAALHALVRYEQDLAYLNLALPAVVNHLNEDERVLAAYLAGGTIRRLNTIDWALNLYSRRPIEEMTTWVRNILRLSAYQLIFMERIPAYAAVNEAVKLARRYGHRGVVGLANALLRRLSVMADKLPWPDREKAAEHYLALKYSIPQWLVVKMLKRYSFEETELWAQASNLKPPVSIRPNRLKNSPEELQAKLVAAGIETRASSTVPGMLLYPGGSDPAGNEFFRSGLYSIQGESSALTAPLLDPGPADTVVDLCSAPGGKTTHLAELMGDQGQIYAVELQKSRLQLIEKAVARLSLKSVQPVLADGRKIDHEKLPAPTAILVDAPCSGLGVIGRLPEIKWRRKEADLLEMQTLQLDLLEAAAKILLSGGKLLYSVCTTEPEETTNVVNQFSLRHPEFELENLYPLIPGSLQAQLEPGPAVTIWPHRHKLDGFYIARWRKNS